MLQPLIVTRNVTCLQEVQKVDIITDDLWECISAISRSSRLQALINAKSIVSHLKDILDTAFEKSGSWKRAIKTFSYIAYILSANASKLALTLALNRKVL